MSKGRTTALDVARRWWLVVGCALLGAAIGAAPEPSETDQQAAAYSATHTMLANDLDAVVEGSDSSITPSQVPLLATTGDVPARVAARLDSALSPAVLARQVEVVFDVDSGALTVTTEQDVAVAAELIADAFAEETNSYLVERQDQVRQERLAASRAQVEELRTQLDLLSAEVISDPENGALVAQRDALAREYGIAFEADRQLEASSPFLSFTTLQPAQAVPVQKEGLSAPTSRLPRALLGMVIGTAVGTALAVVLGRTDQKIRTREQAEAIMGTRARVLVPKTSDPGRGALVVVEDRHDALSDAYRTLRNLMGVVHGSLEPIDRARVVVVVSPGPADGKTSVAANLAAAFVETDQRAIAVNTDFRRPKLTEAIGDEAAFPSRLHLDDIEQFELEKLLIDTGMDGLSVLDLSLVEGTTVNRVQTTTSLMPELTAAADVVIVDTSPVGATSEVLDIVRHADSIVLTVRLGHTRIVAAERTISILRDISSAPIVLCLTAVKQHRGSYHYYS